MMKSLKAQLMAAICMVLVASIALGSATFAWFTQNNTVAANGMQVRAVAAKNLVINSVSDMSTDKTVATTAVSGLKYLEPASCAWEEGLKFFRVSNSAGIDYDTGKAGSGTAFEAVTDDTGLVTTADAASGNVVRHTFYVRVDGTTSGTASTMSDLYISKVIASANQNKLVSRALRVAVQCGTNIHVFAPLSTETNATLSYHGIYRAGTATKTDASGFYIDKDDTSKKLSTSTNALTTEEFLASSTDCLLANEIQSQEYTMVYVYIWYEGEDDYCTTGNAVDVDQISVSLEFAAYGAGKTN